MTLKESEDWRKYIPRGIITQLAAKYKLTKAGVMQIIKREDVLNYPGLMLEVKRIALEAKKNLAEYEKCD